MYTSKAVTDPVEGVAIAARWDPDLLVVDLHMPGLDGLEAMRAVRDGRDANDFLPVLMVTAEDSAGAKRQALAAGVTDFLTKPLDPAEALLRVRNLLALRATNLLAARTDVSPMRQHAETEATEGRDRAGGQERRRRIEQALASDEPAMVFQPIVELASGTIVGAEALARFSATPQRTPDVWFAEAVEVGLDVALEMAAVSRALSHLADFPPEVYLSVNVSPRTLVSRELVEVFDLHSPEEVVVELTEHVQILDYNALAGALGRLRSLGARFAVDDTGSGFSTLQHILRLGPEIIKLDRLLIHDIQANPAKRAMAAALVAFGRDTGTAVVAEGIETRPELDVLAGLGIAYGQGYYLGRPAPLPLVASP
jgi:EAL domain-containing protein (putative c-di-GMP-specific phosphodiesterase class I)